MLFCSLEFLFFFTAILLVYWLIPWRQGRIWLLLGASFYFYASWNTWLAVLIGATTAMDYLVALGMEHSVTESRRKALLCLSLVVNLGILCYFKYANFFLDSLTQTLHALGASASLPVLKVILPIGISFYTFEAINYTVDVYRRRVPAERNLAHFMLFILFFPHLIAGPIVRARDFLPQIKRRKRFSWPRLHLGAQFFFMGLFKKLAIADRMAVYVDPVFQDPAHYSSKVVWLAVFVYAVQIYCDFSGYTDMAIGAAHMLGYKLAQNFNIPYVSCNISEFWRRWHISLSSWLRDYLFIPLGGSRCSTAKVNRNLMITMTLGGLWHGASWTFVVWGVLHGLLLIAHKTFQCFCKGRPLLDRVLQSMPGTLLRLGLTFLSVCIGWIFFRATTFTIAADVLRRMVHSPIEAAPGPLPSSGIVLTLLLVALCHVVRRFDLWRRWHMRVPAPMLGFSYAAAVTVALILAPSGSKPFIYFQF